MNRLASDDEIREHESRQISGHESEQYEEYIDSLLGKCGHQQPTDPIATCDINGKPCLLEEGLSCDYPKEIGL